MSEQGVVVEINWKVTPFRGDAFQETWTPVAEAALDFGATGWALFRNTDGLLDFTQFAFFESTLDFDRYWYSDELLKAREEIAGWYVVPVVPVVHVVVGMGSMSPAEVTGD